ncbi:hypothetical protein MAPG_01304 [Magnaporthiopsis poae ATCC 64411]|uniref:N-acetyltransferase domain-containing protein n=1 Tax=Magnaporthiopsis poae (strain ATCC 64411 / 73-15) TaxID=644358 RepID=A0A0C4DNC3_MAGP6|nr:hypothetical protein MAPG_01304 [Magnaporthiopsis poae ATCC 64411]
MPAAFFPAHLQRPGHDANKAWRAARKSARVHDAGSILMVAVEASGSGPESEAAVVGYAWWTRPEAASNVASVIGASEEDLKSLGETFPPELDRDAVTDMRKALLAGEEAVFGTGAQRHWYELEILAVDPNHHRKGVGKQLVQWGLEMTIREQKDVFLTASPMGRPLYHSLGFKEVGTLDMFGATYTFMVYKNNPDSVIGTYTQSSS